MEPSRTNMWDMKHAWGDEKCIRLLVEKHEEKTPWLDLIEEGQT
jgi:hypothetical protein